MLSRNDEEISLQLCRAQKVKTLLGISANAVKTQIWTALIAMLILKFLQMKSSFGWSLSNLAAMVLQRLRTAKDAPCLVAERWTAASEVLQPHPVTQYFPVDELDSKIPEQLEMTYSRTPLTPASYSGRAALCPL